MKRRKKKSLLVYLLLILLLSIAVGYSLLTQNIMINGTSQVKNNTWDIHFILQ